MHTLTERKTFSKILVPIYESRTSSDTVIDYAIKVAQDYNAQLVILNIIRADANLHSVDVPNYIVTMKEHAQHDFIKITEKIHEGMDSNKANPLRIKTEIVASTRAADAIVSYAKDKDMDLIIIEPRTSSKLKGMLLGNIESDIVRFAHCAVLTVK